MKVQTITRHPPLIMLVTSVDRSTLQKALLPTDHVEVDNNQQQQDKMRLEAFLKASGKSICEQFRQASVLIPLVQNPNEISWDIILTRRALHLKHHPGEISFPGGRYETTDHDLQATAIRETHEEIGITADLIQILGRLPLQSTTSQYHVTPYIGIVDNRYDLRIDENEVSEVFLIPLSFAMDRNNHHKVAHSINGQTFHYHVIEYNQYRIWGATAQMLIRLSERLSPK